MKRTLVSLTILFISTLIHAQSQEGMVKSPKTTQPAAVIELNYPPAVVQDALNDYLSKKGRSKGNDLKGFTTYRNTQPVQGDSVNADIYFKVERKSRKEKEVTTVSLLLTAPDAGAAPSNVHYMTMDQAKDFLNGLVSTIDTYDLELKIKDQNKLITKEESKYKDLISDGQSLQKKRTNIEKNIAENKQQQQKQVSEIEGQKQILAGLVSKRKS